LAWFYDVVDGNEELKHAIAALPGFAVRLAQYRERKGLKEKTLDQKIEEVVARMFAVDPSPAEVDDLCERLFNEGS
jgi:3-methyladenine DNA glycosylase/8-oxoguanine DNA glycosylase